MDNIKDVVHRVIEQIASKTTQSPEKIERIWLNILDKEEREHTRLVGIKEGRLSVDVDSPAWLYQMNTKKKKFVERLSQEVPDIKAIYFKIGKIT